VLAINRGESLKVLTVHVRIPEQVSSRFSQFCRARWLPRGADDPASKCIMAAADDAYKRLIQPLMVRHFRYGVLL
jgi:transcriptional accessory protein Tex/SPT6